MCKKETKSDEKKFIVMVPAGGAPRRVATNTAQGTPPPIASLAGYDYHLRSYELAKKLAEQAVTQSGYKTSFIVEVKDIVSIKEAPVEVNTFVAPPS